MTIWLIENDALGILRQSVALPIPESYALSNRGILNISGAVATISVNGILTPKPDRFAAFFGGGNTAYSDIIDAVDAANSDKKVTEIRLEVGSTPGGQVTGMIPVMDAIRESLKPVTAYVADDAHSAGYGLISQAQGGIYASHRMTQFGSVGVAASVFVDSQIIDITNTDSPDKRPDFGTEEGVDVFRTELDKIFNIFADTIADGRGIDLKKVKKSFGRGASFPAGEALSTGMIDGIGIPESLASTGTNGGKSMDLAELKATHPELVEAIKLEAVTGERTRVSAHLVLGEASGDMERAISDMQSGAAVTQETTAFHTAASIRAAKVRDRAQDNPDLGATQAPGPEKTTEQIADEKICAAMTWADHREVRND